jgi:hypothetical protein
MKETLKNIVLLRKKLQNVSIESFGFTGYIESISEDIVLLLQESSEHIRECYYVENNEDVDFNNVNLGKQILIKIDLAKIPNYYNTISEFVKANKFELNYNNFYIHELDYFEDESSSDRKIENYKINIQFINFLKDISDFNKISAGNLELFFYRAEQGIAFDIDYSWEQIPDLLEIKGKIKDLQNQLNSSADAKERKQIFINELIPILKKNNNSYVGLLGNISILIDNYEKSFDLYLSGFSFDKIKTASIEYFHELTDKIHSTILKYSTYIFAIPITYIFLIRFLDFSGKNILKDTFLLILGIVFFILIWFVLFKNIDDAISSIENDINSFKDKLGNDEKLVPIIKSLDNQNNNILPKQKKKLLLVKIITILILVSLIGAYVCVHYNYLKLHSIKIINSFQNSDTVSKTSQHTISTFAIRSSHLLNPKLQKSLFATANKTKNRNEIKK